MTKQLKLALTLFPIALVVSIPGGLPASPITPAAAAQSGKATVAPTKEELELAKLKAETAKLDEETKKLSEEHGGLASFARVAPFLTAIVALVGVFLTLSKQIGESSHQRTQDRDQREQDRIQRFDEQFNQMVENLGSDKAATRAAATAQIATYQKAEHAAFHEQVFLLLLTALRYPRGDVGDKILVRTFQRAARDRIPEMRKHDPDLRLDLSYCYLARIDLSRLDLNDADFGFADLHGARFTGTMLRRVRGFKVNLNEALLSGADLLEAGLVGAELREARLTGGTNLVSAKLKDVDASGAHFQQARMQEAHLEGATLAGAHFEEAILTNAYFAGATFDDAALKSIATGALNWRDAHFDPAVRAELERYAGS